MTSAFIEDEQRKQEAEYIRTAWLASHLMNASGNLKRPTNPKKLLGNEFFERGEVGAQEQSKVTTKKERDAALADLKQKFGINE